MNKESVLASDVSFFASAMLFAWSPMTGPSCSHTANDVRHCRPVPYHSLRQESQLIPLASRRGPFQYPPTGHEEAAPVRRTLEQHTRLELIHGARRRRLTSRHLPTDPVNNQIIIRRICRIYRICKIWYICIICRIWTWKPGRLWPLYSSSPETKVHACFFILALVLVSIVNSWSNLQSQILAKCKRICIIYRRFLASPIAKCVPRCRTEGGGPSQETLGMIRNP